MSARVEHPHRNGHFFKLVDSLAWELGSLKKEMGKERGAADGEPALQRLCEEVASLFLQSSPCDDTVAAPDSGYDSLRRRPAILDRLMLSHAVWLQLGLSRQGAEGILQTQPTGAFVVRRSSSLKRKVLCVRMSSESAAPVQEFPIRESQCMFSLDGSNLSFADLFRLMAFCCISRDVLPFTLTLPEPIASAATFSELQEVSKPGAGFWDVHHRRISSAPSSGAAPPSRPVSYSACSLLKTRTPSELNCSPSSRALCFMNPLFLKVHKHSQVSQKPLCVIPKAAGLSVGVKISNAERNPPGHTEKSVRIGSGAENPPNSDRTPNRRFADSETSSRSSSCQDPSASVTDRISVCTLRTQSMPEKISWINTPEEKVAERQSSNLQGPDLGSSCALSSSPSAPKRPAGSAPIAIQQHSRSSCLRRAEASSCPDDHVTHQDSSWSGVQPDKQEKTTCPAGPADGGQRLSDMSLSTDSSDSLDCSLPSTFFIPFLDDPHLPTPDDFDTYLPLSVPPSHLAGSSVDEEDDDEEEDTDYGVSFESDQDPDPPGQLSPRRSSGGAVVLQRALRGQLRKMSGVFHSLLPPEKKAVRRILELSTDRTSYFGSLVQDYLSYMGDGAGSHMSQSFPSELELLQTIRQFITQMKSYLRQSSELQPPIESIIPEDLIDRVLEKALLKCVLKPLRPAVSAALLEMQRRSGAWQQLQENLALARVRTPQDMGAADVSPPDAAALERIRQKLLGLCKLYSPEKKVGALLSVCKLVYTAMEERTGRLCGADDFLPVLTFVLARCDMPQLDSEILYMMELLDPALLHGEGGYYLTSAFGAMALIKNLQEEQAARLLSSDTKDTLRQWHRRRTAPRCIPAIEDFQSFLRVALQDLRSGCTAKTLQVPPLATVEDVCRLCALKFQVSDPGGYGLFLVEGGSSRQLPPDTRPQKMKAELLSHAPPTPVHFVYRRISDPNPPTA